MLKPRSKRRFGPSRVGTAGEDRSAAAPRALPISIPCPDFHILAILTALALALMLSQGCVAVGATLLGAAASTATKTGVSYSLDSRAQKTFTAPVDQVKSSLMAALGEMAFPIETDEKTDEGERIVAKVDGREVEVELEPVTPKATKLRVMVREGWFWKDRATAEEIVEQTARGVVEAVMAAKAGAGGTATAARKTPADGKLHPAAALLDPWDPQRWRDGFAAAPTPAVEKIRTQPAKPEPPALPVSPVALPMVALGGGRAPAPEGDRPPGVRVAPATLAPVDPLPNPGKNGDGGDNRWRVIRKLRLRSCPGNECGWGATVKKGEVVVRLREKDQWWRVWLAGTDVVGWVPANELAPQRWWDPPKRPIAASAR